jgi:hypothetical protein
MGQKKDRKVLKGVRRGAEGALVWFATPNGEKREELRQDTRRAKKYRARAAENLRLAESALIQEVRDHHREIPRHYSTMREKV